MRSNWMGLLGNALSLVAVIWMAVMLADVRAERNAAWATADSLLVVTRKQAIIAAKSDSIIALLQRQTAARLDTITALRREHSARAYPKRRAQLDSLTSPLTATPDEVRAWLKQ